MRQPWRFHPETLPNDLAKHLGLGKHGLEKEALRITQNGALALTPHPVGLGSPLHCPYITTDFSESQPEFITPPFDTPRAAYEFLQEIHAFAVTAAGDELLWTASMPPRLPDEAAIPIARYGDTPSAKSKEIYRRGLALRYGKAIQMVCGVHYNFSFCEALWPLLHQYTQSREPLPAFINRHYFALARNFLRYRWLVIYLFGASAAVDASYTPKALQQMELFDGETYYQPYATSLRMSRLGYSNAEGAELSISFNSLEQYIADLRRAIATPHPPYAAFGLSQNGEPHQLSVNQLQIENEYYAPIRVKRTPHGEESSLDALEKRGVAYIEVRASDLDPFNPCGVDYHRLYFMHTMLVTCLLQESPYLSTEAMQEIDQNQYRVAHEGRMPGFTVTHGGAPLPLAEIGTALLNDMMQVAALLDAAAGTVCHSSAVAAQFGKLTQPDLCPSAQMLKEMREHTCSYLEFGLKQARKYREIYLQGSMNPTLQALLQCPECQLAFDEV
ncbi:glutamate--cysteine ligase [Chrysiogenes arsenatis]|uniref:glutamate--cysteine ligase n=1 Tax=Chrysiogenes arsenatis TaxID=309797 RepID=UPI0004063B4E|nr:glutamate--cysteine ligase [Chrysiogenes arsenatis]